MFTVATTSFSSHIHLFSQPSSDDHQRNAFPGVRSLHGGGHCPRPRCHRKDRPQGPLTCQLQVWYSGQIRDCYRRSRKCSEARIHRSSGVFISSFPCFCAIPPLRILRAFPIGTPPGASGPGPGPTSAVANNGPFTASSQKTDWKLTPLSRSVPLLALAREFSFPPCRMVLSRTLRIALATSPRTTSSSLTVLLRLAPSTLLVSPSATMDLLLSVAQPSFTSASRVISTTFTIAGGLSNAHLLRSWSFPVAKVLKRPR